MEVVSFRIFVTVSWVHQTLTNLLVLCDLSEMVLVFYGTARSEVWRDKPSGIMAGSSNRAASLGKEAVLRDVKAENDA